MQSLKSGERLIHRRMYQREWMRRHREKNKYEAMMAFGGRCNHPECDKNADEHLGDLHLIHPNRDGNEHRILVSNGLTGLSFYRALKRRGWNTDGFEVVVMCKSHHYSHDMKGIPKSESHIRQMSEDRIGKKHHAWKGNECHITAKYNRYRRNPDLYSMSVEDWDEFRAFKREEYHRRKKLAVLARQ